MPNFEGLKQNTFDAKREINRKKEDIFKEKIAIIYRCPSKQLEIIKDYLTAQDNIDNLFEEMKKNKNLKENWQSAKTELNEKFRFQEIIENKLNGKKNITFVNPVLRDAVILMHEKGLNQLNRDQRKIVLEQIDNIFTNRQNSVKDPNRVADRMLDKITNEQGRLTGGRAGSRKTAVNDSSLIPRGGRDFDFVEQTGGYDDNYNTPKKFIPIEDITVPEDTEIEERIGGEEDADRVVNSLYDGHFREYLESIALASENPDGHLDLKADLIKKHRSHREQKIKYLEQFSRKFIKQYRDLTPKEYQEMIELLDLMSDQNMLVKVRDKRGRKKIKDEAETEGNAMHQILVNDERIGQLQEIYPDIYRLPKVQREIAKVILKDFYKSSQATDVFKTAVKRGAVLREIEDDIEQRKKPTAKAA